MDIKNNIRTLIKLANLSYSPSFAEKIANEYWQKTTVTHGDMSDAQFDFYYRELKKILNPEINDIILDYGGGNGEIAWRFKRDGYKIDHYDLSRVMRENARKVYFLNSLEENELEVKKGYYDKILVNNCFFYFHLKKHNEVLELLYSLLKTEGRLFITDTPDYEKRRFANGYVQGLLYMIITMVFPVYQPDLAGFWIKHKDLEMKALRIGFKTIKRMDSYCNYRSHWILEK